MSLLQDNFGLVVLLSSAVLFAILLLGVVSLLRAAPRRGPMTDPAKAIGPAAAKAPTDAHMALIVSWKILRQLVRSDGTQDRKEDRQAGRHSSRQQ